MAQITVALVKEYHRIEESDQDNVIALLIDAAESLVQETTGNQYGDGWPPEAKLLALIFVGDFYENREAQVVGATISENKTAERIFQSLRSYVNYFGLKYPPGTGTAPDDQIVKGDDWTRSWRWFDENGLPINITGYTGTFELSQCEAVLYSSALVVSDALNGEFTHTIQDAVTATLAAGEYWYRVRISSPTGVVTTIDRRVVWVQ